MGLLDHRKTWRFRVKASPDECVAKFHQAFSEGGGRLVKAKWSVERRNNAAVAVYEGRKGLGMVGAALSETARNEEAGAIGSEVQFEIEQVDNNHTVCAMWLASRGTKLGITADGRFFRPYMRSVETYLRQIDPSLQVERS
jgi:hypothetical protein